MAFFSDRLISANKLIIAAAVAYTGAVGFAHADEAAQARANEAAFNHTRVTDLAKLAKFDRSLKACSAKFVNDWDSDATGDRNFPMPARPCFMNSPSMGAVVCDLKDCVGVDEWIADRKVAKAAGLPVEVPASHIHPDGWVNPE